MEIRYNKYYLSCIWINSSNVFSQSYKTYLTIPKVYGANGDEGKTQINEFLFPFRQNFFCKNIKG